MKGISRIYGLNNYLSIFWVPLQLNKRRSPIQIYLHKGEPKNSFIVNILKLYTVETWD